MGSSCEGLINQIRGIMEELPIGVRVVKCKDELLGLSRHKHYDVVLLDLNLYKLDEIDYVKKVIQGSDKPVVLISSYASDDIPLDLVEFGAQDFIRKKDIYAV